MNNHQLSFIAFVSMMCFGAATAMFGLAILVNITAYLFITFFLIAAFEYIMVEALLEMGRRR